FVDDKPIQARRVSIRERLWRWCRRNPAVATATGLAAAALVAVTVVSVLFAVAQSRNTQALLDEQKQTQAQQKRAEDASAKLAVELNNSKIQTAHLGAVQGQVLVDQHRLPEGMLWLARALELTPADAPDLRATLRSHLGGLRAEVPVLKAILPH